MDMSERKQICAVRIDQVKTGEPDANGLHTRAGKRSLMPFIIGRGNRQRNFVFQFLMAAKKTRAPDCRQLAGSNTNALLGPLY